MPSDDEAESEDDDCPYEYSCPITHQCMDNPVRADDNHIYDRHALETWLHVSKTSPLTREEISRNAVPHTALKSAIGEWKKGRFLLKARAAKVKAKDDAEKMAKAHILLLSTNANKLEIMLESYHEENRKKILLDMEVYAMSEEVMMNKAKFDWPRFGVGCLKKDDNPPPLTPARILKMSIVDLRAALKSRKEDFNGKKAILMERLVRSTPQGRKRKYNEVVVDDDEDIICLVSDSE